MSWIDIRRVYTDTWKENLRNMYRHILAAAGILLLAATGWFAQEVKTDFDHHIDFAQFKTYSFEKVQTQDPLWVDRIKEAVNAALTAKGWTPVGSGGNVAIVAIETTQERSTLNTFYDGFGGGWRWGGGFGETTTTVETYKVGTLVWHQHPAAAGKVRRLYRRI